MNTTPSKRAMQDDEIGAEHPFAQYIRMLGKGKQGSRSLTEDEAYSAMRMMLAGETQPIQVGAFMMLLRVKEETAAEVAGFVRAVQETLAIPADAPAVALDWSSYAGKRRQLPWFVLSALLLASRGTRVFMHGTDGYDTSRVYVPDALKALGVAEATSLADAAARIRQTGFAFLRLGRISPFLDDLMKMRPILGLRSPVHTISRMINPFRASAALQGIFHPGYRDIHQGAARLLGVPRLGVLKGEGGEIERNPDNACLVQNVVDGVLVDEEWPPMFKGARHLKDEAMDLGRLAAVWRGEASDEYGEAAVIGTTAIALKTIGEANTIAEAETLAASLWANRSVAWLQAA